MMNRRRFLAISAASLATPAAALSHRWQGYAMGAEVSLTFNGDPAEADRAIARVQALLERCEALFSLYRPMSAVSQLNTHGFLLNPEPEFTAVLKACDDMFRVTDGRFDPTVQPLWAAAATGKRDLDAAREQVGWHRVSLSSDRVTLGENQAVTLNGIAQGFATDLVTQELRRSGWTEVLVNIGEFFASGRQWTLGISDPVHGIVKTIRPKDRAVATSSPGAMPLGADHLHIVNTKGAQKPAWSTVSVEASDATTADALSTAFCYATADEITEMLSNAQGKPSAICISANGSATTLGS